jgi:probable F420-dependent oxidoreductase
MATTGKRYWSVMTLRPAAQITEFAQQAETLGLEGIWGIQLPGPPFLPLATAAAGTERLKLGTGIALAFTRSPLETATSALDLDVISSGRVVLGIGPSVRFINEQWHGVPYDKPLQRLQEAVTLIRLITEQGHTGKLGKWEGTYYTVDFSELNIRPPVRPRISIYLSALFTGAVRLAAEVGDGIAGHPVWSTHWIREQVVPNLTDCLKQKNKARQDFELNVWAYVAINADRRQAIADARGTVARYASISQYEKYFAAHGFREAARQAATAAQRQDQKALLAAIPDEMVETFAIIGTPDEVRSKVNALWELADSLTLLEPSSFLKPEQMATYQRAIADTLYG